MRILSLDLATKTGWALWDGSRIESGVQDFTRKRGESHGFLFWSFDRWLETVFIVGIDLIIYEQPATFRSGAANAIAHGLSAFLQKRCEQHGLAATVVNTMTLKKWATGSGRAGKEEMIQAARRRGFVHLDYIPDDNEADALLLLAYAIEKFGGTTCAAPGAAAPTHALSNGVR